VNSIRNPLAWTTFEGDLPALDALLEENRAYLPELDLSSYQEPAGHNLPDIVNEVMEFFDLRRCLLVVAMNARCHRSQP